MHYVDDLGQLATYLKEVRPTIFFAVPRVWERFYNRICRKLDRATGVRASLLLRSMEVARCAHLARNRGERPDLVTSMQYSLFARVFCARVKRAIGLDRTRLAMSGAAPATPDLLEFFAGLDLAVIEGYGQSENTGICTVNVAGATRYGTTGQPLPGVELEFAEDGEILVRASNVFVGYFDDEESTEEALRDGWLHRGDLGQLDHDGFLTITGRKKDIIITAAGKNVTPALIEGKLMSLPLVSQAVVIGDRRPYLTALVVLDPNSVTQCADEEAIAVRLDNHLATVNRTLSRAARIKRYTVLPRPFSIEAGELSPTLKIKRRVIKEDYAAEIAAMCGD